MADWPTEFEHGISDWPEWIIEQAKKQRDPEAGTSSAGLQADLLDVAAALAAIPNHAKEHNKSWDDWNKVAMALHAATGGSETGYALFLNWSSKHPTFNKDETRKRWEQLNGCPPDNIGAGTLFHLAKQAKPGWEIPSHSHPDASDEFTGKPLPDSAALVAHLSINAWIKREITPPDKLLGDLLSTTARVFLVGRTGLGKTNLAVAIAAHIAAGVDFLHWHVARPGRVLYLDGEMSQDLIKERACDAARRLGVPIPSENLIIYSAVDGEALRPSFQASALTRPSILQPAWNGSSALSAFWGKVDIVIMDNVMSLISGDQKDEIPWTETLPLVHWLASQEIGQLWLDHTGHDKTRQYGSSTKAWRFDAVGILSPLDGTDDPEGTLSF